MTSCLPIVARGPHDVLFRKHAVIVTTAMFLHAVEAMANELPAGDYVVNLCQDRYHFVVAFAAALLAGKITLLASDRSSDGLRVLAGRFDNPALLVDELPAPGAKNCFLVAPIVAGTARSAAIATIPVDQVAALVFTSGSTGQPVSHAKLWGGLVQRTIAAGERFGFQPDRPASVIGTVPPQHMYGFETTVLLPLHAPVSSWCGASFYPADIHQALEASPGPRTLVTAPLHIRTLLQAGMLLPQISSIISATAPLDPRLAADAEQRWGTEVFEIFGATEVGSIASRRTVETEIWTTYPDVHLVQTAADDVPFVEAPHARAFPLSDAVDVLSETQFRLLGRPTDLIKLGGRRELIARLNQMLLAVPGVVDGVFIAPDDLELRPAARLETFVVAPDRTPDEIMSALRDRIDPVFLPRRVVCVAAIPRNEVGKLPRQALLALRESIATTEAGLDNEAGAFGIPADHPCLPGHFPGRPIVPGVVLLEEAVALIARRLDGRRLIALDTAKFLAPVLPEEEIVVSYRRSASDRVTFTCRHGENLLLRGSGRLGPAAS